MWGMASVLVVVDPDSGDAARSLASHLGAITLVHSSADALAAVAAGDYPAVILTTDFDDMCHHELARAVVTTCERVGRAAPDVYFIDATLVAAGSGEAPAATPAEADHEGPAQPAIDFSILVTLEADIGDREFVFETIEVYLAELPDRVAAITQGLLRGDLAEVKPVAHSLKSSSAMLGALHLASVCQDIENAAVSGGIDTGRYASLLQSGADATTAELRAHLAS